jgi:hypothetical protein
MSLFVKKFLWWKSKFCCYRRVVINCRQYATPYFTTFETVPIAMWLYWELIMNLVFGSLPCDKTDCAEFWFHELFCYWNITFTPIFLKLDANNLVPLTSQFRHELFMCTSFQEVIFAGFCENSLRRLLKTYQASLLLFGAYWLKALVLSASLDSFHGWALDILLNWVLMFVALLLQCIYLSFGLVICVFFGLYIVFQTKIGEIHQSWVWGRMLKI